MKKIAGITTVVTILAFVLASQVLAQGGPRWRGSGGWGPGSHFGQLYDSRTVETISGEVVKVDRITPIRGMSAGVHLVVKTDKEEISVILGPQWYLENQDVKIEPKERIEINESGVPAWSGWRRG